MLIDHDPLVCANEAWNRTDCEIGSIRCTQVERCGLRALRIASRLQRTNAQKRPGEKYEAQSVPLALNRFLSLNSYGSAPFCADAPEDICSTIGGSGRR